MMDRWMDVKEYCLVFKKTNKSVTIITNPSALYESDKSIRTAIRGHMAPTAPGAVKLC